MKLAFDTHAELFANALQVDAHSRAIATETLSDLFGGQVFKVAELHQAACVGGESFDARLQGRAAIGGRGREFRPGVRELREQFVIERDAAAGGIALEANHLKARNAERPGQKRPLPVVIREAPKENQRRLLQHILRRAVVAQEGVDVVGDRRLGGGPQPHEAFLIRVAEHVWRVLPSDRANVTRKFCSAAAGRRGLAT